MHLLSPIAIENEFGLAEFGGPARGRDGEGLVLFMCMYMNVCVEVCLSVWICVWERERFETEKDVHC